MLAVGIQLQKQNSYPVLMMGEFFLSKTNITLSSASILILPTVQKLDKLILLNHRCLCYEN